MTRTDRVAGAVLLAFSLWILWMAWPLPFGGVSNPGPGFLPRVLGVLLLLASTVVVLRGGSSATWSSLSWPELPRVMAIVAGMSFAALALEPLGFRPTMFALLLFYLGVVERRPVGWVLGLSIALPLVVFYGIDTVLRVPLPRGSLGF